MNILEWIIVIITLIMLFLYTVDSFAIFWRSWNEAIEDGKISKEEREILINNARLIVQSALRLVGKYRELNL